MSTLISDSGLRAELQRITDSCGLREQPSELNALTARWPHTVKFVKDTNTGPNGFNCFMHALNIHEAPGWLVSAAVEHDILPDSCFAAYLVATLLFTSEVAEPSNGDVAMYFATGRPRHAGRVEAGQIVSKWGQGHLWHHSLDEVPSSYGQKVRFFRAAHRDDVLLAFRTYGERLIGASFATA